MKRCLDCDYRFTCGRANSKMACEGFKKTSGIVSKLDEKDGDYYKFSKLEVTNEKE